jgi:PAS domain S-box-containing protein
MDVFRSPKSRSPSPGGLEISDNQERRKLFLQYISLAWLIFGVVTLATLPFFPAQRAEFIFLIALIFPTFLVVRILDARGKTSLAGTVFTLAVNWGLYGLFLVLVAELGADRAFESQTTVWMLMGVAILFAGAFVSRWAAPLLAVLDAILLIATRLAIAPASSPRPSILVFWLMMAVTVWLYEGTLQSALNRAEVDLTVRKQAEKELRQSEERYRQLIDEARDVIFTVSTEGRITSLNPSFDVFIGWPRSEWIGRPYEELLAEDDRERARDQFARIAHGETLRALRLRMHTRHGELLVVEMNISPEVRDGRVVGLLGIARDMTEEQRADDILKASEQRLRALIENSSDAIALSNAEGIVTYASPSSFRLLGYTPEELVGRPSIQLLHAQDREHLLKQLAHVLQHPEKPFTIQYRLVHKDGSLRWIEAVVRNMLADPTVQAVVSNYRDITERKRTETELKRYAENTTTMYQLSQQILTSLNLDDVYENSRQAVQKIMPCDAFVIALLTETAQEIEDAYLWDHGQRWPGETYARGHGLTDYVISSAETLFVNEWAESHATLTRSYPFGYSGRDDTQSVLAVPLFDPNGRCFGMISAQCYSSNAYTPEDERLLVTLGNQISEAIRNARLVSDLQRSNSELSQAYDATIEGWSLAMDLRDKETEGHTRRVTELTVSMARSMGLPEEDIIHIRRGGLLHDIGKIGVPDQILYKSEGLSEAEWEIMRMHPVFAHEMLSSIAYLEPALDIPYCHHEKWDGTGYPRGLKGEQIPLAARIFAIADVWDAVTSDRPYRAAWTKEKSLQYIREQSGKYFDPAVAEVFLDLIAVK